MGGLRTAAGKQAGYIKRGYLMDDVRALLKEFIDQVQEFTQPAPKQRTAPKLAALVGSLLFAVVLVRFIIEWRRVPTMSKLDHDDQAE
jgi:uncharacterized membrane protein